MIALILSSFLFLLVGMLVGWHHLTLHRAKAKRDRMKGRL